MTPAVEPGVLYDWPTHVPLPNGYPPWGTDPVAWRRGNQPGWGLPDPADYGISLTRKQKYGLWQLGAAFGLAPSQFVEWLQEIGGDFTKVFGMLNNGTRAWRLGRQSAFSGDEMGVALIWLLEGIGGSGKSRVAVELMWWDHLARHFSGYYRRHGFTPSDKFWRFGPWNFCADAIEYDENRTRYPDHVPTILDDPLTLTDAQSGKVRQDATNNITNLGTKERDRGRTFAFTNVFNEDYDPRLFTETGWMWSYARVADTFAYLIRRTRRSTENYKWTEFLLPLLPSLDIGGPLAAAPGTELDKMFRAIKQKAHDRLYSGKAASRPAMRVDLLLAENPEGFLENCLTMGRLEDWMSDEFSSKYSMGEASVAQAFSVLWRAFGRSGYVVPPRSRATGNRWTLFDPDGEHVHSLGEPPRRDTALRLARRVREKLPLDKSRLESERAHRRRARFAARRISSPAGRLAAAGAAA